MKIPMVKMEVFAGEGHTKRIAQARLFAGNRTGELSPP